MFRKYGSRIQYSTRQHKYVDYYPSNIRYICIILYLGIQIKRFPNELVPKIKARFYGRETYKSRGSISSKHMHLFLLLILFIHLNLSSMQVYYTFNLLHASTDEGLHIEMPRGFK